MGHEHVNLTQVVAAVQAVASEYPSRVDARAARDLAPRYVEHGTPCCLVAEVLARLGWSVGQLKQLDHEADRRGGGIALAQSRHRRLRRIDPVGRDLLVFVQCRQDRGRRWADVVAQAFQEDLSSQFQRPHLRRFPWMSAAQGDQP